MGQVTRRTAISSGLALVAASEAGQAAGREDIPLEPTITFPEPITAMTEVMAGRLAVATGSKLYIIKIR